MFRKMYIIPADRLHGSTPMKLKHQEQVNICKHQKQVKKRKHFKYLRKYVYRLMTYLSLIFLQFIVETHAFRPAPVQGILGTQRSVS